MSDNVRLANLPASTDFYRPSWMPTVVTPGEVELARCMEENPAPFPFGDIATATVLHTSAEPPFGGMGEYEWSWRVVLRDGRIFKIDGWHDFTGWDCQSGAEYTEEMTK